MKKPVPLYVAPSSIHGNGLYAARDIKKGRYIGTYRGPAATRDGTYVLWVDFGDRVEARSGRNKLRYLNHSDTPNAEFDAFELYALRHIEEDEELTINYNGPQ